MQNINRVLLTHIPLGNMGRPITFSWTYAREYTCIIAGYEKH